jgi:hypothetical protein
VTFFCGYLLLAVLPGNTDTYSFFFNNGYTWGTMQNIDRKHEEKNINGNPYDRMMVLKNKGKIKILIKFNLRLD